MEFIDRYICGVNGQLLLIERIRADKVLITNPAGLVLEFGNEEDAVAFIEYEMSMMRRMAEKMIDEDV